MQPMLLQGRIPFSFLFAKFVASLRVSVQVALPVALLVPVSALAQPMSLAKDQVEQTVIRTAANPGSVNVTFTKSIYRTEYRAESYTVDVPYTETETYWETEPRTKQEFVCNRGFSGTLASANLNNFCFPSDPHCGGGIGGHPGFPDHRPGFPDHRPGFPDHRPGFPDHRPGFPDHRPGHPHQPHCRWESVTTYEEVQKTRTVTHWRTETRCCQQVPYKVLDHVWTQPVELRFPVDSALVGDETEKLVFRMSGKEGNPTVAVEHRDSIFRYVVASETLSSGALIVDLAIDPHISAKEAGEKSVGSIGLSFEDQGVIVRLQDKVTNSRVQSAYVVRLVEKATGAIAGETQTVTRDGEIIRAPIAGQFDAEKDYIVQVAVSRSGVVVKGPIAFTIQKSIPAEKVDARKVANKSLVHHFRLDKNLENTVFRFMDDSPNYMTIRTKYQLRVTLTPRKAAEIPLGEVAIDRQSVNVDKRNQTLVNLASSLKLSDEQIALLAPRTKVRIDLIVTRSSKRTGDVVIQRVAELEVRK